MDNERKAYTGEWFLDAGHPHFEGHFPGYPIFPAVAQVELVVELLSREWKKPVRIGEVKRAKFKAILKPGTRVVMTVTETSASEVRWVLRDETQIYSQGDARVIV